MSQEKQKLEPTQAKTIWQFCWRGAGDWYDALDASHAEVMRGRNCIVREVIVLRTITSCEDPPVTVFSK